MGPIPAKYFWPGFCALLLAMSVGSAVVTVVAAQSDGGAEIVASYDLASDERSDRREQRRENRELGWNLEVDLADRTPVGESTPVTIRVRDRHGAPLDDLEGQVRLHSPALADPVDESTLVPDPAVSGRYRAAIEFERRGLWDFVIRLQSDDHSYVGRVRKEL